MPKQIFVIGIQRSGTTWLANILCQHPNIAGVCAERHFGIVESFFFSNFMGKFGDIRHETNFNKFVNLYSNTDYFILSGLKKDIYSGDRPQSYPDFFRKLMNCFVEKEKADFWLEKSPDHTLYLETLSKYYPHAKFIGINREIVEIIKSTLQFIQNNSIKRGRGAKLPYPKLLLIIYFILRYTMFYKNIEHFCKRSNSIKLITYEQLMMSPERVITKLCEFLGIKFTPQMLERKYSPNTSFFERDTKGKIINLTSFEKQLINVAFSLMNVLPYGLYRFMSRVEKFSLKKQLKPFAFTIRIEEKGFDLFRSRII